MLRSAIVLLLLLLFVGPRQLSYGQTYGFRASYEHDGTRVFRVFRVWVSPDTEHVRGAIVLWAGAGQDWRGRVEWTSFQHAARSMDFALIGTHDNEAGFTKAEVNVALQRISLAAADASGRPELQNAPLVLMGFSQGGYRSSRAAALSSGRVLALVGHKGTQPMTLEPAGQEVPALFIAGETDANFTASYLRQVAQEWRDQGGRAAFAVDWNVGHNDLGNQGWEFGWFFAAEAIRLRYPVGVLPSVSPATPLPLNDIELEAGWLGDKARFANDGTPAITSPFFRIDAYANYAGANDAASWLPSEPAAWAYRAFTSSDLKSRAESPFQTPIKIVSPAPMDTVTVGSATVVDIDPRDFAVGRTINEVLVYEGATLIGPAIPETAAGRRWSLEYTPDVVGVQALVVVARDDQGNARTSFRTISVLPADSPTSNERWRSGSDLRFEVDPIFPNPTSTNATLTIRHEAPAVVHVGFFDMLGRRVGSTTSRRVPAGEARITVPSDDWPGGVYLCRITRGTESRTVTFSISR